MSQKKVLLVDDSGPMRLIIRYMVNKDSRLMVIGAASNGEEAMRFLRYEQPDLILLDIEMPEMDGLEFLRRARLLTRAKVVIVSSAATDSEKARQARALGADAVISKPSGALSVDLEEKRGHEFWQVIYPLLGLTPHPATQI